MSWVVLKRVSLQATITLYSAAAAKSPQSCPTLCDPIDSSPPGSPVPGILQARTLEWVAISFSTSTYILHDQQGAAAVQIKLLHSF